MVYDNALPPGLGNLLAQRSQEISFNNNTTIFWPCGSFNDLFTSEAVLAELWPPNERPSLEVSPANSERRELLVAFILEKSKTIFAILLSFLRSGKELRQAVSHFRDAGLDDSNLPITSPDIKSRIFYKPGTGSKYRQPWSAFREKNFCDVWQWRFTAPVFQDDQSFLGLPYETILPFTKVNSHGPQGSGQFGDVYEVTVHPAHIGTILPANRSVSIKKLYRPQTDDLAKLQDLENSWQQEVSAHKELDKCRHPNIIKFIAGITRGNDRYLMCEWANGGNLREFWTKNEPNLTRTLVKDVIVQLQGITDALKMIHGKGFRHGDLKPENIVRQDILPQNSALSGLNVGELKICDMGSTRYHTEATEFRNWETDTRFATWRYEPPEALIRSSPWSRRFDIWSIGCVILEFIVWMLEGSKGLDQFNNALVDVFGKSGQYFEWEKERGSLAVFYVHRVVEEKIKALSSQRVCKAGKTALGDLLAIVETRLLVVRLSSADTKQPIRGDSAGLKGEIDKIVKTGTRDPAYWLEGKTTYRQVSQTDSGYASMDDADTVYSDDSTMIDDKTQTLILEFAHAVIGELFPGSADDDTIQLLYERLPDAIRAFALRIGGKNSTLAHRDVMHFAHKYRRSIALEVRRILWERVPDGTPNPETEISSRQTHDPFPVANWLDGVENDPHALFEPPAPVLIANSLDEGDEYEAETVIPEIAIYTRIVSSNVAYKWLMTNLKRDVGLMTFDDGATTQISNDILSSIEGPRRISRHKTSDIEIVTFTMEWNPKKYLSTQFSNEDLIGHTISDTITLTGSSRDAFAASCRDYLIFMWPNTGMHMASLIDNICANSVGSSYSYDLEDGSQVTAKIVDSELQVRIYGGIYTIVEIAEQLGWLGSALNDSPSGSGVAGCTPHVSLIRPSANDPAPGEPELQEYSSRLGFRLSGIRDSTSEQEGECWHNLFRNPTIAMTYPIPRREIDAPGLEIPLEMMAALIQAKEVQIFKETLFLKGFSAMLALTGSMGSELMWHLNYNEQGKHISYLDVAHQCLSNISIGSVETSRHFVGWCSRARYLAGSVEANYTIRRSRLGMPGNGFALEKISVTGGKIISAGATFAIGNKDRPVHVVRDDYIPRLQWISKKHVVFWDEADKRGWLVNGSSALLHLVRASLEINRTDKFNKEFLFESKLMKTASKPHTADSAIEELLDRNNMQLKVYPNAPEHHEEATSESGQSKTTIKKTQSYIRFQDRVNHIFNVLEKLIDHQIDVSGQNGVNLKRHIRTRLEGWDFKDIASDSDPFYPRVATLHSMGRSWVDFVRSIQAVTLLGCGFGDLLEPVVSPNLCPNCVLVPKHRYYLTAGVRDLEEIMEMHGNPESQPPLLCQGVCWYQDKAIFDKCQSDSGKHQDLAQVLMSSKTTARDLFKSTYDARSMPQDGAVIFGHNSFLKWFYHDHGEPVVSEEPDPHTPEDAFLRTDYALRTLVRSRDSGLGSSNSGASNSQFDSRAHLQDSHSITDYRAPLSEDQGSATNDSKASKRRPDDLYQPPAQRIRENVWKPDERHRQARYKARNRND